MTKRYMAMSDTAPGFPTIKEVQAWIREESSAICRYRVVEIVNITKEGAAIQEDWIAATRRREIDESYRDGVLAEKARIRRVLTL